MTAQGHWAPILRIVLIRFRTGNGKIGDIFSSSNHGMPEDSGIRTRDILGAGRLDFRVGRGRAWKDSMDGISNRDAVPCSMQNEVRGRA